jgi:hypothetical protein
MNLAMCPQLSLFFFSTDSANEQVGKCQMRLVMIAFQAEPTLRSPLGFMGTLYPCNGQAGVQTDAVQLTISCNQILGLLKPGCLAFDQIAFPQAARNR